ncbi:hypothetical protein PBAL39_03085 [Pedobacter sp. BAL39]|uniref:hypothetical protein n=1 Tax=Pedobacter sp. BAL39 TaxID=391596 RepID=UPI000155A7BD|nr:hypothetical protein [Pedobacter sp. BAL39]EDM34847.1 hypothetical protein PBAL39_03085 [Pedobacter sp. BAL39]
MDIEKYIRSGILELYALGLTSHEENQQILVMCARYARVQEALDDLIDDMENFQREINGNQQGLTRHFKDPQTLSIPEIQRKRPSGRVYDNLEMLIPGLELHRDKYADEITLEEALGQPYEAREEYPYQIIEKDKDTYTWVNKTWLWAFALILSISLLGLIFMFVYYVQHERADSELRKIKTEKSGSRPTTHGL